MKYKSLMALTLVGAVALLPACSSPDEESAPQASQSSGAANSDAPTEPTPAPAEAEPAPKEREIPAECASLTLAPDQTYTGAALSKCVAQALVSFGSGKMDMSGVDLDGTVQFTYDPNYSFEVAGTSNGTDVKLVYTNDVMWVDTGGGWVKGDIESSNQEEMLAGVAGEMYRIYADPSMTAELIASGPEWQADSATATKTLPSGEEVETFRIANTAPFDWHDFQVEEFVFWYGADWVPVASQATSSVWDMPAMTYSQDFYELGADISILPPQ